MTQFLRVRNWEEFQHYKDRQPPWIKLHRGLLRDYEFACLQDASKLHLMLIWLLASQTDNKIPADPDYIRNQIGVTGKIDLSELINKGFLIDDSNTLAQCKQVAMPETETEVEVETEVDKKREAFLLPDWVDQQTWKDFLAMRTKIKKPATEAAKRLIVAKLDKFRAAGHDPNEVLKYSIENSYQGVFEPKEVKPASNLEWLDRHMRAAQ